MGVDNPDWQPSVVASNIKALNIAAQVISSGQIDKGAGTYTLGTIPGGSTIMSIALSAVARSGTTASLIGDVAISVTDGTVTVPNILDVVCVGGLAGYALANAAISQEYTNGLQLKSLDATKTWTVQFVVFDDKFGPGTYTFSGSLTYA
ncbi:MAG TPA: hypothetical protein VMU66_05630 [Gaiellales bacterium]|nr:hypothetical protein [Gaiellales bacterium]